MIFFAFRVWADNGPVILPLRRRCEVDILAFRVGADGQRDTGITQGRQTAVSLSALYPCFSRNR